MQKNFSNPDIWTEASNRFETHKVNQAIEEWQQERKQKGLPWTIEELGKEMHYHRNTISKWMNGKARPPIDELCSYFKKDPSYFIAQNLEELDLMNRDFHTRMEEGALEIASKHGVSKSFLWFLKSDQDLQNMVIEKQPTDATLNSFDPDVPDVGSPVQFIHSNGEKVYLNEYSLPILGRIEPKVKEYIEFLLWNEFKRLYEKIEIIRKREEVFVKREKEGGQDDGND